MNYAIPIMFLLVPYGFIQFGLLHGGHHLAFVIAGTVILAWQMKNRAASYFLTYLATWMTFIFIFSMFREVPKTVINQAMDAFLFFSSGALIFYCVTQTKIKKEVFYNVICIAALLQMVIGILQKGISIYYFNLGNLYHWFNGNTFLVAKELIITKPFDPLTWTLAHFFSTQSLIAGHMTGTLGNNNFLAAFVAISMPFFWRCRWVYAMPVIAYVLYYSNTTSAVVPAIMVSAWYFKDKISKREQILAVIGGALVIVAYACFQHTPFYLNPRWVDWTHALKEQFFSPFAVIFGMCPGAGWGKTYPMHNEWLQSFYQYGIVGLSLIIWFLYPIVRSSGNRVLHAALLIALINMFGNYSLHLAPSAFLILIIAGLIERERAAEYG